MLNNNSPLACCRRKFILIQAHGACWVFPIWSRPTCFSSFQDVYTVEEEVVGQKGDIQKASLCRELPHLTWLSNSNSQGIKVYACNKSVYNFEPLYGIKSCKLKVYHWQNKAGSLTLRLTFVELELQFDIDMHGKLHRKSVWKVSNGCIAILWFQTNEATVIVLTEESS